MPRLCYVIVISLPIVIFYLCKSNYVIHHMDNYSEEERYNMFRRMIKIMQHNGRIHTDVYGYENLPTEGGYVMYPNHQGKYDVLGIVSAHENPCTFVIDAKRSTIPFAREITALIEASPLDKDNPREQIKTIKKISNEVSDGRRYIIFPEGGYDDNKNTLLDFAPGSFKCSVKSKTPIVPVALINSYKVFGENSLRRVNTQVHFLPPLEYADYAGMSTLEIADLVLGEIKKVVEANQ